MLRSNFYNANPLIVHEQISVGAVPVPCVFTDGRFIEHRELPGVVSTRSAPLPGKHYGPPPPSFAAQSWEKACARKAAVDAIKMPLLYQCAPVVPLEQSTTGQLRLP